MKLAPALSLFVAAVCVRAGVAVTLSSGKLSPVSRVVQLLQQLGEKVEEEIKSEEKSYKQYVCWGTSVVDSKTASNAKAQSRIDSLKAYIADLEAGRIELTTERVDLEKEIASLSSDIEQAEASRKKEKEDFEAAKAEMDQAITALDDAVEVLKEGTSPKSASLLRTQASVATTYAARIAEAGALLRAVELGRRALAKEDAGFLERVLTGEVPKKDWKKLNRKAEYKMKYETRSKKIQSVLSNMRKTFQDNLEEAESKEAKAVELHEALMKSKGELKDKAVEALAEMKKEGSARGLSKSEAEEEVGHLEEQITKDDGFIKDTKAALESKEEEWKKRKELRMGEAKAISEAIAILHNDDARDLFKRSLSSQGYIFIQLASETQALQLARSESAAATLTHVADVSGDNRLAVLSRLLSGAPSHFKTVIEKIDDMVSLLEDEAKEDLAKKEKCEESRASDTREAAVAARDVDEKTDTITKLFSKISEIEQEIAGINEEMEVAVKEREKATEMRDEEKKAWEISNKDDMDAISTIESAITVLTEFYKNNGLSLAQRRNQQTPEVVAGEAPPPPPATFEGSYQGKQGESKGIISILTMIKTDVEEDKKMASASEEAAEKEYKEYLAEYKEKKEIMDKNVIDLTATKGETEQEVQDTKADRGAQKDELEAVLEKIKGASRGCNFMTVNYEVRASNRQLEIDGLKKAKAILSGAKFE